MRLFKTKVPCWRKLWNFLWLLCGFGLRLITYKEENHTCHSPNLTLTPIVRNAIFIIQFMKALLLLLSLVHDEREIVLDEVCDDGTLHEGRPLLAIGTAGPRIRDANSCTCDASRLVILCPVRPRAANTRWVARAGRIRGLPSTSSTMATPRTWSGCRGTRAPPDYNSREARRTSIDAIRVSLSAHPAPSFATRIAPGWVARIVIGCPEAKSCEVSSTSWSLADFVGFLGTRIPSSALRPPHPSATWACCAPRIIRCRLHSFAPLSCWSTSSS